MMDNLLAELREIKEELKNLKEHQLILRKYFSELRDSTDSWIKQIKRDFAEFSDLPYIANENTDNIQHNYELIYEIHDKIEELKQEINALKLIQIINVKQNQKYELKDQIENLKQEINALNDIKQKHGQTN